MTKHFQLQTFLLLVAVILIWGINWPLTKLALQAVAPLWLAALRMLIATICLLAYLLLTKKLQFPNKQDMPVILSVSFFQMVIFNFLVNTSLLYVSASRSVILVYTTPLWVTPMAMIIFKETLPFLKWVGLLLGLAGIGILFNPASLDWHDAHTVIGNILLLLAAIAWAVAIVHVRYAKWRLTALQLLPWQTLIATVCLLILALLMEGKPNIQWSLHLFGLLFYIGVIGSAFAYWAAIEVARRLPAVTTSLCLLGVPVAGLFSAHFILAEKITTAMVIAMLLLLTGLSCVTLTRQNK